MKNNAAMEDHWSNNPQAFPNDVKPITDRAGMTGWRKRQVVDMAREAGLRSAVLMHMYGKENALCDSEIEELRQLERFAALVRDDEREKFLGALRQLHDSYSLASDSNDLKKGGKHD